MAFLSDSSRNTAVNGAYLLVVRDIPVLEDLYRMQQEVYGDNASYVQLYYGFDLMPTRKPSFPFISSSQRK